MTLFTDLEPLSKFISDVANGQAAQTCADISDNVQNFIQKLKTVQTEQYCLPIQESVVLLETAQRMWNEMALHTWSTELCLVRAQLKYIVTHLYLLGNNYFAPVKVKSQYFTHHFIESEKCVVMCLKAAKSLSQNKMNEPANQLLSYASAIIEIFDAPIHVTKLSALRLETCFAQLSLAWDASDAECVVRAASKLEGLVAQSLSYTEALLQFIFSAAEREPHGCEGALRVLLDISLRLQQQSHTNMSAKEQSFLGITMLQMANVLLRCSDAAAALAYAEESAQALDSLEPLIVQIKAHLMLQHTDVAGSLFTKVASNTSLTFEEVLGLSTLLAEINTNMLPHIIGPCRQRMRLAMEPFSPSSDTSQTHEEGHPDNASQPLFQYASFLLHVKTQETILELIECLKQYPCEDLYTHFFFLSLWSVSYECSIEVDTQIHALHVALQFRQFVPKEETEGLLTSLATVTLKHFSEHHDIQTIQNCLDQFRMLASDTLGFYALVSRCQLSLLAETEEESVALVRLLCQRFGDSEDAPSACGQLLYFLLAEEQRELAATVAQLFIQSQVKFDDVEKLEVLHVCALTALVHLEEKQGVARSICAEVVPLLELPKRGALLDVAWWCRFLWQVSDSLTESDPRASVQIALDGVLVFKNFAETQCDRDLLLNRIWYVLRSEFIFFYSSEPLLPVDTLSQLLLLASEVGKTTSAAGASAVTLATTEETLRRSTTVFGVPHTIEKLRDINVGVCDLEKISAVFLKAGIHSSSSAWRDHAVDVQMLAIEKCAEESCVGKKDTVSVLHVLSMYYKGYHMMDSEEQRRRLLTECQNYATRAIEDGSILDSSVEHMDGEKSEEALELRQSVERMFEFFCVESWNTAVKKNAMHRSTEVENWMKLSLDLSRFLSNENVTKHTIKDFAVSMPITTE